MSSMDLLWDFGRSLVFLAAVIGMMAGTMGAFVGAVGTWQTARETDSLYAARWHAATGTAGALVFLASVATLAALSPMA